jgi:hypothetical protein
MEMSTIINDNDNNKKTSPAAGTILFFCALSFFYAKFVFAIFFLQMNIEKGERKKRMQWHLLWLVLVKGQIFIVFKKQRKNICK